MGFFDTSAGRQLASLLVISLHHIQSDESSYSVSGGRGLVDSITLVDSATGSNILSLMSLTGKIEKEGMLEGERRNLEVTATQNTIEIATGIDHSIGDSAYKAVEVRERETVMTHLGRILRQHLSKPTHGMFGRGPDSQRSLQAWEQILLGGTHDMPPRLG